jgi:hypothetical protein
MVSKQGQKYNGEWENSHREGTVTFTAINVDEYTGNFKMDLNHGKGAMKYATGNVYIGDWKTAQKMV